MRRKLLTLVAAPIAAAAVAAGPASAAELRLVSGNAPPPGRDALTHFSTDGGATWQPAYVVVGDRAYHRIPGSEWISASPTSYTPAAQTRYRRIFDLPAGCTGATLSLRIHVDNAATVSLNGTGFGATPAVEQMFTFQNPPEGPYTTGGPFRPLGNVLEFVVRNFTGPTALNFEAVLTCAADTAPPVVDCTLPEDRWYAENVTVACTATDSGSGLADTANASFQLSTSVPAGAETANATTDSREVCDAAGNCVTAGPYGGLKVDRLAPALTLPGDLAVDATGPAGAVAAFAVSASDGTDPSPAVQCTPEAGSTLGVGSTVVTCRATDHAGNAAAGSFTVYVRGAVEQIMALADKTLAMLGLSPLAEPLRTQLHGGAAAVVTQRPARACALLAAYRLGVELAARRLLTVEQRAELTGDATRIRAVIGCS